MTGNFKPSKSLNLKPINTPVSEEETRGKWSKHILAVFEITYLAYYSYNQKICLKLRMAQQAAPYRLPCSYLVTILHAL